MQIYTFIAYKAIKPPHKSKEKLTDFIDVKPGSTPFDIDFLQQLTFREAVKKAGFWKVLLLVIDLIDQSIDCPLVKSFLES